MEVFPGQRYKTNVKWKLVLMYGRFYITYHSQGKILLESQMIMEFNEVLEKYSRIPPFHVSEEKMGDFRFWVESDAWGVSFCFRLLYIADIL